MMCLEFLLCGKDGAGAITTGMEEREELSEDNDAVVDKLVEFSSELLSLLEGTLVLPSLVKAPSSISKSLTAFCDVEDMTLGLGWAISFA
eukprot:11225160-Ditylum_brightwellii.AAC.1